MQAEEQEGQGRGLQKSDTRRLRLVSGPVFSPASLQSCHDGQADENGHQHQQCGGESEPPSVHLHAGPVKQYRALGPAGGSTVPLGPHLGCD
ncbi:hypothetical protein PG996_011408 [Apiospora saccharicola]|uniref:Uncharacterized protein n=1 Tax=Apiospora saccharicola TaxID=335842 RepID=A0ABR1UH83_9PEZI